MNNICIGYDDNLGLPAGFSEYMDCEFVSYHDLSKLIAAFESHDLDIIFIPAGTLPYLKQYEIVSQSLFGPQYKTTLLTKFVTTKSITLQNIQNHTLGHVNQYCTTSYWAPQIYLMQFLPKNTKLQFIDTNGFVDMLDKTAAGMIDGSMVWDIILQKDVNSANKVHEVFYLDGLPTPVLVAHSKLPPQLIAKLNNYKAEVSDAFFTGFQAPDLAAIQKFLLDINKAIEFYKTAL